ncbi:MAG: DsrE family protein [Desulfamplus sp.]|nr:DsrE family protein [Desulfamplus sp.]MBF0243057.1 DsrE family protein [Desulfamplus sp.]
MENREEKILYILTCGGENPEKASMPFVLGNAALAMDVPATVCLQGNGVYLAQKGYVDHVAPSGGFPHIKKLLTDFIELGGKISVCVPCIKERNITPEDLIEGAETTAAAKVNLEAMQSSAVFVY